MVEKDELKKNMIRMMEQGFQDYFVKVAGVYDLGLKHFREYCQEAETISKLNKEKNQ